LPSSRSFSPAPPSPEISTLSLHDALPILATPVVGGDTPHPNTFLDRKKNARTASGAGRGGEQCRWRGGAIRRSSARWRRSGADRDRKSTRLNSSHVKISYAVFCLKKKKKP